jgi:hypothetical protein
MNSHSVKAEPDKKPGRWLQATSVVLVLRRPRFQREELLVPDVHR